MKSHRSVGVLLHQKFLIGFLKISQVTLVVAGGSGLPWPATPLQQTYNSYQFGSCCGNL